MTQRGIGSWVLPIAVVAAVAGGVWWFVFRESAEERGHKLLQEATAALRDQDYATAERKLQGALDAVPDNGVLLHNLGILYLRQNRLPEARKAFERAAATHGPEANQVRAEDLYQLATISYMEKRWPLAVTELESAIVADPTRVQLHARLIDLQLRRVRDEAAADSSVSRFLRLCGRTSGNLEAAAYVYYQNDRWAPAERLAREAVALADSQTTAQALAARTLWRQGVPRDGLQYLESPLVRYPRAAPLWVARGAILLEDGQRKAALVAADTAVALAPRDIEARDLRRHALANNGRLDEAITEIEIARQLTNDPGRLQVLQRDANRLRALSGIGRGSSGAADSTAGRPASSPPATPSPASP